MHWGTKIIFTKVIILSTWPFPYPPHRGQVLILGSPMLPAVAARNQGLLANPSHFLSWDRSLAELLIPVSHVTEMWKVRELSHGKSPCLMSQAGSCYDKLSLKKLSVSVSFPSSPSSHHCFFLPCMFYFLPLSAASFYSHCFSCVHACAADEEAPPQLCWSCWSSQKSGSCQLICRPVSAWTHFMLLQLVWWHPNPLMSPASKKFQYLPQAGEHLLTSSWSVLLLKKKKKRCR